MGVADEVAGRAKEAVGALTDNDDLRRNGKADRTAGKAKDAIESIKEKFQSAMNALTGRPKKNA